MCRLAIESSFRSWKKLESRASWKLNFSISIPFRSIPLLSLYFYSLVFTICVCVCVHNANTNNVWGEMFPFEFWNRKTFRCVAFIFHLAKARAVAVRLCHAETKIQYEFVFCSFSSLVILCVFERKQERNGIDRINFWKCFQIEIPIKRLLI